MDLRGQLALGRTWLPLFAAAAILGALAGYGVSLLQAPMYEARATLIVGQSLSTANPDYNELLVSQRLSETYAAVATKRPILDKVIAQLGLGVSADALLARVQADAQLDSTLLTVAAQDTNPDRAAAIANAIAAGLMAESPAIQGAQTEFEASLDADLSATRAQIASAQAEVEHLVALPTRTAVQEARLQALEGRLVTLRSTYATFLSYASRSGSNLLTVIEPATPPTDPVSPKPLLNALLAGLLGLLVAVGFVSLRAYLDDTVKTQEDVESVVGSSALGSIGRMRAGRSEMYRLATLLYPRSAAAEAYRKLRVNIEFAAIDSPIRSLLVTSALPREGKTVTSANLAVAFAQAGRRVLLVDADLRKPGVHEAFRLPNDVGLTTLLLGDGTDLDDIGHATEQPLLTVLTTGPLPASPADLLGSQRMAAILGTLTAASDLVIIDSPPVQSVTDAAVLSAMVDGTLLVLESGRTRRDAARHAREALARAGAHVIGVVLNRVGGVSSDGYARYRADAAAPAPVDAREAMGEGVQGGVAR